jgi:hypothetical protein
MNKLIELGLWTSLEADEGDGPGGGGADDVDLNELVETAYDSIDDSEPPEAEDADEPDFEDPLAVSGEFAEANPEVAQAYEEQVDLLRSNIEAMAPMLALEQELGDPARAPMALRQFVEAVANHHGYDAATMLGLSGQVPQQEADWRGLGFRSEQDYLDAPEWQREGFDSPNEFRLAQELDELRSLVAPSIQAQREADEAARRQVAWQRFEGAVRSEAPRAIAALNAEHGWRVTDAQAIEAAARFPELASQDLKSAILAAFPVELARHYAGGGFRGGSRMPEMLQGGDSRGVRIPNPDNASIADLAEFAYSQI